MCMDAKIYRIASLAGRIRVPNLESIVVEVNVRLHKVMDWILPYVL
jgi:hypothetical protein